MGDAVADPPVVVVVVVATVVGGVAMPIVTVVCEVLMPPSVGSELAAVMFVVVSSGTGSRVAWLTTLCFCEKGIELASLSLLLRSTKYHYTLAYLQNILQLTPLHL